MKSVFFTELQTLHRWGHWYLLQANRPRQAHLWIVHREGITFSFVTIVKSLSVLHLNKLVVQRINLSSFKKNFHIKMFHEMVSRWESFNLRSTLYWRTSAWSRPLQSSWARILLSTTLPFQSGSESDISMPSDHKMVRKFRLSIWSFELN